MHRSYALAAALSLVAGLGTTQVSAAETRQLGGLDILIGAGALMVPDYEGSDDYEAAPLLNLQVRNLYHPQTFVRLIGPRLESNLLPHDHWRLGPVVRYLPNYEDVDDERVERLDQPEDALQAGLMVGYDFASNPREHYVIEVEGTYDALNGNGGLVTPRVRIERPITEKISWGGIVSATWASGDYMSNRFGISRADSGRSGLREFDADAGFKDLVIDLALRYSWTENWSIAAIGGYRRILNDAADSPIVDDRGNANNFTLGMVINYRY